MKRLIIILPVLALLGYAGYRIYKPAPEARVAGGAVYYFPKANVYYSLSTGEYMYYAPGQGGWVRDKHFTEEQKLTLGESAEIDAPAEPVWERNAEHRLLYSVSLYAKHNDLGRKRVEDSLSSLPRPVPRPVPATRADTIAPAGEEKKSGIRRFFENLFRKGKKEEKS